MGLIRTVLRRYLKQKRLHSHQAEIDAAVEKLFYEINPRLSYFPGYQEVLGGPVWNALRHVHQVIDSIAGPVDAITRQWGSTPALRALFANSADMSKLFNRDTSLHDCMSSGPPEAGEGACHAMIAATMQVRKVLGISMRGNILQRDVPQTQISFSDHRIVACAGSESALREKMKSFALEFVAHRVLANIEAERSESLDLEQELALLRARMRMKLRQDLGKGCLCDRVKFKEGEVAEICARIREKEALLSHTAIHHPTLEYFMEQLLLVLNSVESLLQTHPLSLRLDNMNLLLESRDAENVAPVELTEMLRAGQPARVMLIMRVPPEEVCGQCDAATRIDEALKWL